jgi:hypothetical protein
MDLEKVKTKRKKPNFIAVSARSGKGMEEKRGKKKEIRKERKEKKKEKENEKRKGKAFLSRDLTPCLCFSSFPHFSFL